MLTAVSNQMGADVRALTARLVAAGGSAARERDVLMPVTGAEGVIFSAIAGAGSTCIPAVPDLCRHAGRLLASLGVAGDGFVARPERHGVAAVGAAGAPAVMR